SEVLAGQLAAGVGRGHRVALVGRWARGGNAGRFYGAPPPFRDRSQAAPSPSSASPSIPPAAYQYSRGPVPADGSANRGTSPSIRSFPPSGRLWSENASKRSPVAVRDS